MSEQQPTGSDISERLWEQSTDDGNYEAAERYTAEQAQKQANARRLERQRAYIAVYHDPTSPLYRPLPRDLDCDDRRQHGAGDYI